MYYEILFDCKNSEIYTLQSGWECLLLKIQNLLISPVRECREFSSITIESELRTGKRGFVKFEMVTREFSFHTMIK